MKLTKVLSLVLVVVMLASMLIACGDDPVVTTPNDTTPAPTTPAPTTPAPTTPAPTTPADTGDDTTPSGSSDTTPAPSTDLEIINWGEKGVTTVNVLGNNWYSTSGGWCPVEFWVSDYGQSTVYDAVLDRADYLNTEFGVTFTWTQVGATDISTVANAIAANTNDYDLWFNKTLIAQEIVANNLVYDLADSEYIDFSKSYYNQLTKEAFTVSDHTFFASGDFNFIAYDVTYFWFVNNEVAEEIADFPEDIYQVVRDGEWTLDLAFELAAKYHDDVDGNGIMDGADQYGLYTNSLSNWYNYCGISTVTTQDGEYVLGLSDTNRVQKALSYFLQMVNSDWFYSAGWEFGSSIFTEGRCLFFQEVVNGMSGHLSNNPNLYIVPNPKMNESDSVYYTTGAYQQANMLCIPKTSQNRELSEYFFEILFKTSSEEIIPLYLEERLINADPANFDDVSDMLMNYIFPGAIFDVGSQTNKWSSLCGDITSPSIDNRTNTFAADYAANVDAVQEKIDTWNANWAGYVEE